mgnify:CR=1 FL=1
MKFIQKSSVGFLRTIFFALGVIVGGWWIPVFVSWSITAWFKDAELGLLFIVPALGILSAIIYLGILSAIVFRPMPEKELFVKRIVLFFSVFVVTGVAFLASGDKLYELPFIRISNAPLTVFDTLTLEKKIGFKPLLPTKSFPGYSASSRDIREGVLSLDFTNGATRITLSQDTYSRSCEEVMQMEEKYSKTEITIANQNTYLYVPKTIAADEIIMYCAPLADRMVSASTYSIGQAIDTSTLRYWLENLK